MRRRALAGLLVAGVTLAAFVGLTLPAGAQPPVPSGSVHGNVARPNVYPGSGVITYGDATNAGGLPGGTYLNSMVVGMAPAGNGGYWLAGADGGVYAFNAPFFGSVGYLTLQGPVVAMASTPDHGGYWLAAMDGGVFAFGDAQFYGSMGGQPLNQPIVGMASTSDGGGYWLVAADGGIFSFGDAQFYGSMGGQPLNAPVTGMASVPGGGGYWLVAADGGIFSFGDAQFYGSMGGQPLNAGVTGMAATGNGQGYWMVGWDGGVFTFGDAGFFGSAATGAAAIPVTAIVPTPDNGGYWLLSPDSFNYSFANPPPNGAYPGSAQVVAAAESQVQPDPDTGYFCNPYGPCEEWCALFATWALQQGGIGIPSYAFTGDIYTWGAQYAAILSGLSTPIPGDVVLYGTGPANTATSVHTGIVAQVWPDGAILTIEGDAGPGTAGHLAVVINGPFMPGDSITYNGFGIYAYVQP
jgi:hypothetical protein